MIKIFNRFMNFLRKWHESDLQFLTVHHPLTEKGNTMSLQDTIAADQTALEAAKHTVDMAQAQLDADVARLAAIQPQLDNFDAIETMLGSMPSYPIELRDLIAKGRALLVA